LGYNQSINPNRGVYSARLWVQGEMAHYSQVVWFLMEDYFLGNLRYQSKGDSAVVQRIQIVCANLFYYATVALPFTLVWLP
jgi:hypothetical protein